jgi:hypothetical protein
MVVDEGGRNVLHIEQHAAPKQTQTEVHFWLRAFH